MIQPRIIRKIIAIFISVVDFGVIIEIITLNIFTPILFMITTIALLTLIMCLVDTIIGLD